MAISLGILTQHFQTNPYEAHGFPWFFVQESDEEDDEKVEKRLGFRSDLFGTGHPQSGDLFLRFANHG